ncbi:MAG: hypothetical protein HYY18_18320 [Planctomycetes bacterium]|nr:hypothetical protein [Planctomycetota bacterium]
MPPLAELPPGFGWILLGIGVLTALTIVQRARARRRDLGVDLVDKRRERVEGRESLDEIFVKLQEFSRDTLARLDTKIRMLNELLARADSRIAELRALSESRPRPPEPPPGRAANPLHEKIFRLADEGRTQPEITEATGLQRGEIELILGLREKRT